MASDEQRPPTYEELQTQVQRLSGELHMKNRMLDEAMKEIVALRNAVHESVRRKTPRVLDPQSTDAFSRPFR